MSAAPMGMEELQKRLRHFVSPKALEVTGERDAPTEAALVLFQRKYGIGEVGFVAGDKLNDETLITLRCMDQDMEPRWLD